MSTIAWVYGGNCFNLPVIEFMAAFDSICRLLSSWRHLSQSAGYWVNGGIWLNLPVIEFMAAFDSIYRLLSSWRHLCQSAGDWIIWMNLPIGEISSIIFIDLSRSYIVRVFLKFPFPMARFLWWVFFRLLCCLVSILR